MVICSFGLKAQSTTPAQPFKLFFEKVYLHTDREQYVAGEDIWFRAYLVNGQNNQLLDASNNLYVELINADNKIADRKLIRLDNGLGHGDFKLGNKVKPGVYRIRAYTNWMRNFSDYFVFEKKLSIYNSAAVQIDPEAEPIAETPKKRSKNSQLLRKKSPLQYLIFPQSVFFRREVHWLPMLAV